jgi:hypothetical protein
LKYKCRNFGIFINQNFLLLTTMNDHNEITKKKAALTAELYKLEQCEKAVEEVARREQEEEAAQAAWNTARKEAKRALRAEEKGKKRVLEEDVGETEVEEGLLECLWPKKQAKMAEMLSGADRDSPLEITSTACKR